MTPDKKLLLILFLFLWRVVGSILRVEGGSGSDNGCFIQLNEDSTLTGFSIFYPNQKVDKPPAPYPW